MKILALIWLAIFGLFTLIGVLKWLTSKTELEQKDYYGHYVINRDYFSGRQADWQYDHFRFEIKKMTPSTSTSATKKRFKYIVAKFKQRNNTTQKEFSQ